MAIVKSSGSALDSSSQVSGVDTVAIGVARTEYALANVRSPGILVVVDEDPPPRSSFHQEVVTKSVARLSISRANAMPARRTAMKSQSVAMRR